MIRNWHVLARYLSAGAVCLSGISNILAAWLVHTPEREKLLHKTFPIFLLHGSWFLTILAGTTLLFLAWNLGRGKREAWRITLIVLLIAAFTHLVKGLNYEEATVNIGLFLILLFLRQEFRVKSDPPSLRRGILVFVVMLLFIYSYGVLGFYLLDRHFHRKFDLPEASRETLILLTMGSNPNLITYTPRSRLFLDSVYIVELAGIFYVVLSLFRPIAFQRWVLPSERQRAIALLEQWGNSSLAYLTLLPDKTYFFSASGDSYVAYTVVGNVAMVLGDPIGPAENIEKIIAEFKIFCAENDWHPVFYQTLPDFLPIYQKQGFQTLKIGEEAIVNLETFTLSGGRSKNLRQTANHALKKGYSTEIFIPPQSDAIIRQLKKVSDIWLKSQKGTEKRFSLGWFDHGYLTACKIMVVRDNKGEIVAFTNIIPTCRRNEGTIDLMRRLPEVEGAMDFLFVHLAGYFQKQGYTRLNLGLAPLSGVGEKSGAKGTEKVAHFFYENFNQFYNFKGLRHYKEKFNPDWEPRYLIYPHILSLPKVVLAIIRANAGSSLWSYLRR